ncbi:MAG TPA: D-xylose ABC transporter ATP-binding protein [Firmicutes bacterium]|nr:D-xylose ABC transporter ATP-binding protein [Bacillota bacterium]
MNDYLLELIDIQKSFGKHSILKGINLRIKPGEIHGLIGKNGAGKTVLMKIVNGVIPKDSGRIIWRGKEREITSVKQAQSLGFSMVYQDLSLFPDLTVAENIFAGHFAQNGLVKCGVIELDALYRKAQNVLDRLHFTINARTKLALLGLGQQQMVEIARAISRKAELLILDEPTAALNEQEVGRFFQILKEVQALGVTIIYISHRIQEIKEIAQNITIIRDGLDVASFPINTVEGEDIIKLMVGEEALGRYPRLGLAARKELLRVEGLSTANVLSDISFTLHEREILGIAGLAGSGRTALVDAIFGVRAFIKGKIFLRGREIKLKSPRQAIKMGFAYLAEDRVHAGLFNNLTIKNNIVASDLTRVTQRGFINAKRECSIAQGLVRRLGILIHSLQQRVSTLSSGNQQKIMLAKWLFSGGYVYLLDEPTNGLDIASKVDVYNIMNSIICGGSGVIMISSDLSELIGMCHRVLVIFKGTIVGELKGSEISEEKILKMASGRG